MGFNTSSPSDDEQEQLKLLCATHTRFLASQNDQSKELYAKTALLFGLVVSIMTLYGTYATRTNGILKTLALLTFAGALVALCFCVRLKNFHRPPLLDDTIDDTTSHFNKLYQDVVNLGRTTEANDKALKNDEKDLQRAIWIFTAAMILMTLSLVIPNKPMLSSEHNGSKPAPAVQQPAPKADTPKSGSL